MRKTALKINKALISRNHTYKQRTKSQINWIVIHYVGALGDAKANCEYYGSTDVGASADFFVGHNGDIWQANDYWNYYSWHCGGGRQSNEGGEYFRKCMNANSVGIEMCVKKLSKKTMNATDRDWYFEDATIKSTVALVKQLMKELDIDVGHVIRHFDVNGKYCVPLTTELLTPDGWTKLSDIIPGDMVMQFDPNGDKLEFTEVLDTVEPYMSEVLSCRKLDATANHRMYVRPNCVNSPKFRDVFYGDILSGRRQYLVKNAGYYGEGLPLTDDQLKLLVWVQGDGHYMHAGDNHFGIEFHLSKERKITAVHELLNRMDIPYRDNHKSDGTISIRIYSKPLLKWCEEWLFNKEFTYKFVEMSQPQFELFWDELLKVDGCVAADCYTSVSQNNLDVVQAVCATHGMRTNKNTLGSKSRMPIAITRAKSNYSIGGSGTKVEKYNAMVSCVTVKSGYILVRQNGRTFIIGNCPNPFVFDTGKVKWADFKAMISGETVERHENDGTGTQAVEFQGLSEADAADKILEMVRSCDDSGILYSVTSAQMILESGYVTTDLALGANNCFGMKCELSGNSWPNSTWDGLSRYTKRTAEQTATGKTYYVTADFRKYPCIEDSIKDHAAYLLGAQDFSRDGLRYTGLLDCKDYESAIKLIKKGGYATDVNYVSKICSIVKRFELDRYDKEVSAVAKSTIQKAVEWAIKTAKDDSHGYDNTKGKRTGPDYACSSFIAAAWRAAGLKTIPADAYTATMRKQMLDAGFEDVTADVNLKTGKGMKVGDVVLIPGKHVEMVANAKHQLVGARGNATGGAENGKAGDQTGEEISLKSWFDFGWKYCLRYKEKPVVVKQEIDVPKETPKETPKEKGRYVVQAGAFSVKANAQNRLTQVRKIVPDAFLFEEGGQWKVQAGSFSEKANAEKVVAKLTKAGLPAFIRP